MANVITDSSKFEKMLNNTKKEVLRKNCKTCPLKDGCDKTDCDETVNKFLNGEIVFSHGELIELEGEEIFEIVIDEETGDATVTPDIYEGDEILQSRIFKDIKPVRLDEQGNECDDGVNHMVKIPKIHYEMRKEGSKIFITVSREVEIGRALAHTRDDGIIKDNLYVGRHLCSEVRGLLVSQPDKDIKVNISFEDFNKSIRNNYKDTGYKMIGFHQITLLQILYLLRVKKLDSKKHLGAGVTNNSTKIKTGGKYSSCAFYGDDSGKTHVSVAYVEDFFGNTYSFVDGFWTDEDSVCVKVGKKIIKRKTGFGGGSLTQTIGTTEFGFCPLID